MPRSTKEVRKAGRIHTTVNECTLWCSNVPGGSLERLTLGEYTFDQRKAGNDHTNRKRLSEKNKSNGHRDVRKTDTYMGGE